MLSTMQNSQLSIRSILEHGISLYPKSKIITYLGGETTTHSYAEIGERAAQLAHALFSLAAPTVIMASTLGQSEITFPKRPRTTAGGYVQIAQADVGPWRSDYLE